MAKIHGSVYLIAGLIVSLISWKIDYERFMLFFYVGLVFVMFGVFRLVSSYVIMGEAPKTQKLQQARHVGQGQHHQQRPNQAKYCNGCGLPMHLHDNYCRRCGTRA
jgi:hypothetical protein